MKENFKIISDAFIEAGIEIKKVEFKITEYSLNTSLSFKFENLDEFFEFLQLSIPADDEKKERITLMLVDEGIDPKDFFYVNFYKPKVAEL